MLNNQINLQECIDILNKMLEKIIEWDFSGDEVEYIVVEPSEIKSVEKLITDKNDLEIYLKNYYWDEVLDIAPLWGYICDKFEVDMRFDAKNKEFHII